MKGDRKSMAAEEVIAEFTSSCLLMRTRLISRVLTGIYDQGLREFGLNSPQFSLLVVIFKMGSASRAEIGRYHYQDRSTLTRNLKIMMENGWIGESSESSSGRARPVVVTASGINLLRQVESSWREAQEQVKSMLGKDNVLAIEDMVKRIRKTKPAV